MTGIRPWWVVSGTVAIVILVTTAALPPVRAISNGTIDTVHTYVGALIFPNSINGTPIFTFWTGVTDFGVCSGTLVAPRVFLTAGHCTAGARAFGFTPDKLAVSFATNVFSDRKSWLAVASYVTDPDFQPTSSSSTTLPDANDLGVIILAKPVEGIAFAALAPVGFLDAYGKLTKVLFPILGYGLNDTYVLTGDRRIGMSGFGELADNWLKLSGRPSSVCPGDSGGPTLLASGGVEYEVSLHSSLNDNPTKPPCASAAYDTRIDTASSRAFISAEIAANP